MSRFAKLQRVFFVEEPIMDAPSRFNEIYEDPATGVCVVTPHLPSSAEDVQEELKLLLDLLIESRQITHMMVWYYLPSGMSFTHHLKPDLIVYDCMDEHSGFKFAHPSIKEAEKELMDKADIVFTGGQNLFEAKKHLHPNIYPFPSSIDKDHFMQARLTKTEPPDQASIPHPRIGFYGVVDERFDVPLISSLARMHPEWHFVIVGPVVKIDPEILPRMENIHWLGKKEYNELPVYLSGWDIAMMPFALNESTEFISPTKTPEYLAGGKPVISTSIKDVVKPYGALGLVEIADSPRDFAEAIKRLLEQQNAGEWLRKVDAFLTHHSWDKTWMQMVKLIHETQKKNNNLTHGKKLKEYV
jgi:UDP-galactopyranose mutase